MKRRIQSPSSHSFPSPDQSVRFFKTEPKSPGFFIALNIKLIKAKEILASVFGDQMITNLGEASLKTTASRTTGAKGCNSFARNNRLQVTDDHMERIRLQVSANNK